MTITELFLLEKESSILNTASWLSGRELGAFAEAEEVEVEEGAVEEGAWLPLPPPGCCTLLILSS